MLVRFFSDSEGAGLRALAESFLVSFKAETAILRRRLDADSDK
jgi:hypothetical protein